MHKAPPANQEILETPSNTMITKNFGASFEKKGLSRILYFLTHAAGLFSIVLKSGKLAELLSFAVWELFEKLGVYRSSYLEFINENPLVQFEPTGELHFKKQTDVVNPGEGSGCYALQPLSSDWAKTFTDGKGVLWGTIFSRRNFLFRSEDRGDTAVEVYRFPQAILSIYVSSWRAIFVCAEGLIYKSEDDGVSFRRVFEFATTNSRFRHNYSFTEDPSRNLFVGEYGLATDQQGNWKSVAWIYMSEDGGDTWQKNDFFIRQGANKHIHLVKYCTNLHKLIVTDGDNRKRLWVNDSLTNYDQRSFRANEEGWRLINKRHIQMGGHTAIVELGDELLFGTDYLGGTNFLLRTDDLVNFQRTVVPDPYRHSLIQNLFLVQSGNERHLWAWLNNMTVRGPNAKGLLMYSWDGGNTWTKFFEYDGTEHWHRVISSSNEVMDYLLITVDERAYRIQSI